MEAYGSAKGYIPKEHQDLIDKGIEYAVEGATMAGIGYGALGVAGAAGPLLVVGQPHSAAGCRRWQ